MNKGEEVKLSGRTKINNCLMSGSHAEDNLVVKDRRTSLPLATHSGQPEDNLVCKHVSGVSCPKFGDWFFTLWTLS